MLEAIKLGIDVYRPAGEGGRYDMIFDLGATLLRVQCKWAPRHGDVVLIRCYSNRRTREGLRRRVYTRAEIDAIAAYFPYLDRCYVIPTERLGRSAMQLRVAPSRNNQRLGINWADDFELGATLRRLGAVAQLGERCHGMAEARGSSPL